MDASGWPTADEVIERLTVVSSDVLDAGVLSQVAPILKGVIADFQSPQTANGGGGTGRLFTPTVETRVFDGTGYPRLYLGDDVVPNTTLTVTLYGSSTPLTDVVLMETKRGLGYNTLVRQFASFNSTFPGFYSTGFPTGIQNVSVSATWGYAAQVPYDVYEAVMGQVIYKVLSSFVVDIAGAGIEVEIGNNKVNTAAGVSVWAVSSPLGVMRSTYLDCIKRYRTKNAWQLKQYVQRMS